MPNLFRCGGSLPPTAIDIVSSTWSDSSQTHSYSCTATEDCIIVGSMSGVSTNTAYNYVSYISSSGGVLMCESVLRTVNKADGRFICEGHRQFTRKLLKGEVMTMTMSFQQASGNMGIYAFQKIIV